MNTFTKVIATTILGLGLATSASAATSTFSSYDNGWITDSGSASTGNTNVITGNYNNSTYSSYFLFDLTSFLGGIANSATVVFSAGNGSYVSPNDTQTLELFDVDTDTDLLETAPANAAYHTDISTGNSYGTATVGTGSGSYSMPEISIDLSAIALQDINSVLSGSDGEFAIGAALVNALSTTVQDTIWSSSSSTGVASLVLNGGQAPAPVPLPAALPLLLAGMGALGVAGRRRRK